MIPQTFFKTHLIPVINDSCSIHTLSDPSPDQISTFWSTFLSIEKDQEDLLSEIDRDTVSGEVLRRRLVETGKFQYDDAAIFIERMYKLGVIDRVSYDTYRRKK